MGRKTPRLFTPIESLRELYSKHALDMGDKVIFRYHSKDGNIDTLTYSQFKTKTDRIAAGLDAIDLTGKRVAIIGETSPEWFSTYLAVVSCGGVIIPLDKELVVDEISGFLNSSEAEALVFSRSFNKKYEAFSAGAKNIKYFIPMDPDTHDFGEDEKIVSLQKISDLGQIKLSGRGYKLPENYDKAKMSIMLFTSGTTGTSKCVMLSEKNMVSCINAACATVDFCPDDVLLSVLPIHHTYECTCMLSGMNYGVEICINDSIKNVLKNLQLFKPTGITLVPLFLSTFYKRIWDEAKKKGKDDMLRKGIAIAGMTKKVGLDISQNLFKDVVSAFGGRLKKIVCGGAAMDPIMVKNFAIFGMNVVEGYGITECSPLISVSPYFKQKKGSVGPAVPCCTVMIDNPTPDDDGRYIGEILVKGDNVMLGYYNNEEATKAVFTDDGWFRTGDLGYMDSEDYIYITGRKKNVIVLNNGKNVFPEEIEEYLDKLDIINECIVVGRTNKDTGEVVLTAVVYPNFELLPDMDLNAVAAEVKAKIAEVNKILPGFKQIRNVEIKKTEFEKTSSRKIKRYTV